MPYLVLGACLVLTTASQASAAPCFRFDGPPETCPVWDQVPPEGQYHAWGAEISANGQRVAFVTEDAGASPDAYEVVVVNVRTGRIFQYPGMQHFTLDIALSTTGRYVAFTVRDDDVERILVTDLATGVTEAALTSTQLLLARDLSISSNGRYIAFHTFADHLGGDPRFAKVFVIDRETDTIQQGDVTSSGQPADGASADPVLSGNGRFVAFRTEAPNLTGGSEAWQIALHDLQTGETELVSVTSAGTVGDDSSGRPTISVDGRFVAFETQATNLGALSDSAVVLRDRQNDSIEVVSFLHGDQVPAHTPGISPDGRYVAFFAVVGVLEPGGQLDQPVLVVDTITGRSRWGSVKASGTRFKGSNVHDFALSRDGRYLAFDAHINYNKGKWWILHRGPIWE